MARPRRSTARSSKPPKPSSDGHYSTETVALAELRAHPRNYRSHPDDQLDHIAASLREHGLYRNVVVARDGTILAGHGVVKAAIRLGWREIEVRRVELDPDEPRAIKILTGDNELGRFAEVDDRLLADHLKLLAEAGDLAGTGYDEQMLANLVYVTRPVEEVRNFDEAAAWAGMPGFEPEGERVSLVLAFDSEEDRARLIEQLGIAIAKKNRWSWSAWWPPREREDLSSLRWETG